MTTQLQPRIDISNVVVDRSENIVYKNKDEDAHIPEFARQRLKPTAPGGKVQISRPGVPSSGAPKISQPGELPGEKDRSSRAEKNEPYSSSHSAPSAHDGPVKSSEVQSGIVAAARRSFLQKPPEPEAEPSPAPSPAAPVAKKPKFGAPPKANAKLNFFGMPAEETEKYQKPKLPSKTQTKSTSTTVRDGIKTTSTKTTTTERTPTDKHDKAQYMVSHEIVKIDENTEDDITKTTKILGGMQYDVTRVIRSVKENVGMNAPGKSWSKDTPSPRNMPAVMKEPASQPKQKEKPKHHQEQRPSFMAPKGEEQQPSVTDPKTQEPIPTVRLTREPIPKSNVDRASISNRLEGIFGQNQQPSQQKQRPEPSAVPPPKRKKFGDTANDRGGIANKLELILGGNQQPAQTPAPAPLPPPKRKEFGSQRGCADDNRGALQNQLSQMLALKQQQQAPTQSSSTSPQDMASSSHKQASATATTNNKGTVTVELAEMFAKRQQQQKSGVPTTSPTPQASEPVSAARGAVTNRLEQMLSQRHLHGKGETQISEDAAADQTTSETKATKNFEPEQSPKPNSSKLEQASASHSTSIPQIDMGERSAPEPEQSPRPKPAKPEQDSMERATVSHTTSMPKGDMAEQSAPKSTPAPTQESANIVPVSTTVEETTVSGERRLVRKTVISKTVNTTVIRQKIPKGEDRERDGGVKPKQPSEIGFCCAIM